MNLHSDHEDYLRFTGPARLDKAVNSLLGILEGVTVDSRVTEGELAFLVKWVEAHEEYRNIHPFNELLPVLAEALADGVLASEEREDLVWLCRRLRSTDYYDAATADMQRLHAMMAGIAADGVISAEELLGLSRWLEEHEHLRRCWPYDEVDSLVTGVLSDGSIDEREQLMLVSFFSEFVSVTDRRTMARPLVQVAATLQGLCAVCPAIEFSGCLFCFTGASLKYTRSQFSALVQRLGGRVSNSVTRDLDYLVIGADGNPCWSYSCYGRKVEQSIALRKKGSRLLLVHENDFHDAVANTTVV